MTFENLQQNFSNATGLILDRTFDPPLVLGEAFIVSKSRAVACASSLFNYVEAPWALVVSFPHPDLTLGVKSVAVHPEFDKKEARTNYLTYSGAPPELYPAQLNDFATIVMDPVLPELLPEKVGELQRALTIPFSNVGIEASGAASTAAEILQLIKTILDGGREGLLTFFDQLNVPIARIQFAGGNIQKVYYKGVVGEMGFSELLYRQPTRGFAFSSQASFSWGNIRDVVVPANALIQEAQRRVAELPAGLSYLGGSQAIFRQATQSFDASSANENIQWLIQTLWGAIDGYITIDKLSQRVGADTYTVIQGLREMMNRGIISHLPKSTPFACSGQLGTPLVSHTDFDINPGDPLQAFFLDPLSGAPVWKQGNFSGVSSVLQPKNLLHNVPVTPGAKGALILKNYKLVGVHNGNVIAKAGQPPTNPPVSQMMFMSAMFDMSARKLRGTADGGDSDFTENRMAGLRTRAEIEAEAGTAEKIEKYICPNCYSTNTKLGPCFNCGTIIHPPEPEVAPTGVAKYIPMKKIKQLQEKYNVTNQQLIIGGSCAIGFPLFALMFCSPQSPPPVAKAPVAVVHTSSADAIQVAADTGFKATPPPDYWYENTLELTKPSKSFGIYSEAKNQKMLFVIFDDMSAVQRFDDFLSKPLYVVQTATRVGTGNQIDRGSMVLGSDALKYYAGHYEMPDGTQASLLVAGFPSKEKGKSVLAIGQAYKDGVAYDYKGGTWLIDQMTSDWTKDESGNRLEALAGKDQGPDSKDEEDTKAASSDDVKTFYAAVQKSIQDKFELPDGFEEELKAKKSKKLRVNLLVGIGDDGAVKKIELTEPSEVDKINNALIRAVNQAGPFKDVPNLKDDNFSFYVKLRKDQIKIERP